MTTTTVEAGQPAVEVLAEVTTGNAANVQAAAHSDPEVKKLTDRWEQQRQAAAESEKAPYNVRELRTAMSLLSLRIEEMVRDFNTATGLKIDTLGRDYSGQLKIAADHPDFGRIYS